KLINRFQWKGKGRLDRQWAEPWREGLAGRCQPRRRRERYPVARRAGEPESRKRSCRAAPLLGSLQIAVCRLHLNLLAPLERAGGWWRGLRPCGLECKRKQLRPVCRI